MKSVATRAPVLVWRFPACTVTGGTSWLTFDSGAASLRLRDPGRLAELSRLFHATLSTADELTRFTLEPPDGGRFGLAWEKHEARLLDGGLAYRLPGGGLRDLQGWLAYLSGEEHHIEDRLHGTEIVPLPGGALGIAVGSSPQGDQASRTISRPDAARLHGLLMDIAEYGLTEERYGAVVALLPVLPLLHVIFASNIQDGETVSPVSRGYSARLALAIAGALAGDTTTGTAGEGGTDGR